MRHNYKGRKLGTDFCPHQGHEAVVWCRRCSLNDRIKTIESRAKEIRPDVDKIITWAKKGDLHCRRLAIAALGNDKELVREIFEKVEQGMFADRQWRLHSHHEAGQPQGRQRSHGHHGARHRAGGQEG